MNAYRTYSTEFISIIWTYLQEQKSQTLIKLLRDQSDQSLEFCFEVYAGQIDLSKSAAGELCWSNNTVCRIITEMRFFLLEGLLSTF